jgi:hypothetical protein
MNRNNDAENPAGVRVLEAVEFDLSGEGPQAAAPGKSEAPVTVLSEVRWSLGHPPVVPMLQLTFYLRPEVDPAGLSFDVLRFFQGLSQYERELGGTGLTWDEAHSQGAADAVRLVVAPNERRGAKERLTRLADLVMGVKTISSAVALGLSDRSRSFTRWEAVVLDEAA